MNAAESDDSGDPFADLDMEDDEELEMNELLIEDDDRNSSLICLIWCALNRSLGQVMSLRPRIVYTLVSGRKKQGATQEHAPPLALASRGADAGKNYIDIIISHSFILHVTVHMQTLYYDIVN